MMDLILKRPAGEHPDPEHWARLRERAIAAAPYCRAWRAHSAAAGYTLELHHIHYNTWGHEALDDVLVLCEQCHAAITSVIRHCRHAHDPAPKFFDPARSEPPELFRPSAVQTPSRLGESRVPDIQRNNWRTYADHAQRANGGPAEPIREADEDDHGEPQKD